MPIQQSRSQTWLRESPYQSAEYGTPDTLNQHRYRLYSLVHLPVGSMLLPGVPTLFDDNQTLLCEFIDSGCSWEFVMKAGRPSNAQGQAFRLLRRHPATDQL